MKYKHQSRSPEPTQYSVKNTELEVGQTYHILGTITDVWSDEIGQTLITVNENIHLYLNPADEPHLEEIKKNAFEPGIFISHITVVSDIIRGNCDSIVFADEQNSKNLVFH